MHVLALAAIGTADLLAAECRSLGLAVVAERSDGVELELDGPAIARALVHLRVASRLLLGLGEFEAWDGESLYEGAVHLDWPAYLDARSTFSVHASGDLVPASPRARGLDNHVFIALRVKDAIADRLVHAYGRRPDVDKDDPDLRVVVRGRRGRFSVWLDLSSPPLHQRGYRVDPGPAPLKETLAAALAFTIDWQPENGRLHDAMSGGGTFVVEAVSRALGVAPGCTRWFGVERWPHHGPVMQSRLDEVRGEACEFAREAVLGARGLDVVASDIDSAALDATEANLAAAGLSGLVKVERADACRLQPPVGTTIFANPPYGERLGDLAEVVDLYRRLGRAWSALDGCDAFVLDGQAEFLAAFGLAPEASLEFRNGPLTVALRQYALRGLETRRGPTAAGAGQRRIVSGRPRRKRSQTEGR